MPAQLLGAMVSAALEPRATSRRTARPIAVGRNG